MKWPAVLLLVAAATVHADAPRLTSAGMWHLTELVHVARPEGLLGFPPGTIVYERRRSETGIVVHVENIEFTVWPHQLTNDSGLGRQLKHTDRAQQAHLREWLETTRRRPATPTPKPRTPRPQHYKSPLERGPYQPHMKQ